MKIAAQMSFLCARFALVQDKVFTPYEGHEDVYLASDAATLVAMPYKPGVDIPKIDFYPHTCIPSDTKNYYLTVSKEVNFFPNCKIWHFNEMEHTELKKTPIAFIGNEYVYSSMDLQGYCENSKLTHNDAAAVSFVPPHYLYAHGGKNDHKSLSSDLIRINLQTKVAEYVDTIGEESMAVAYHCMVHVAPHYLVLFAPNSSSQLQVLDLQTRTWHRILLPVAIASSKQNYYHMAAHKKRIFLCNTIGLYILDLQLDDSPCLCFVNLPQNAFCDILVC